MVATQVAKSFATAQVTFGPKQQELRLHDLVFQALAITFGVVVQDEVFPPESRRRREKKAMEQR
jgi:hypothetical protein